MSKENDEYRLWLKKEGCADNPFNFYRFRHNFTAYHVGKMMNIPQTCVARYVDADKLTGTAFALFKALNYLDSMKDVNVSSLDLF